MYGGVVVCLERCRRLDRCVWGGAGLQMGERLSSGESPCVGEAVGR